MPAIVSLFMLHAVIAFHETRIQHPDEISTHMMDTCTTITTENILTKDLSTFKTI